MVVKTLLYVFDKKGVHGMYTLSNKKKVQYKLFREKDDDKQKTKGCKV